MKLEITKLTLEEFKALNLKGYEHRKHYFNPTGQKVDYRDTIVTVPAMEIDGVQVPAHTVAKQGYYSKICWEEVDLGDVADELVKCAKEEGEAMSRLPLVIAIHKDATKSELEEAAHHIPEYDSFTGKPLTEAQKQEELKFGALYFASYMDKWLTQLGAQTYLARYGVEHLYSLRDYFVTKDDYFKVKKKDTKAVYLISI